MGWLEERAPRRIAMAGNLPAMDDRVLADVRSSPGTT
jgi:hypothetical protein